MDSVVVFLAKNGYVVRTTLFPEPESDSHEELPSYQDHDHSSAAPMAPPSVIAAMRAEVESRVDFSHTVRGAVAAIDAAIQRLRPRNVPYMVGVSAGIGASAAGQVDLCWACVSANEAGFSVEVRPHDVRLDVTIRNGMPDVPAGTFDRYLFKRRDRAVAFLAGLIPHEPGREAEKMGLVDREGVVQA